MNTPRYAQKCERTRNNAKRGGFALSRRSARSFAFFRIKGGVQGAQGDETRAAKLHAKSHQDRQEGGIWRKAGQHAARHRSGGIGRVAFGMARLAGR